MARNSSVARQDDPYANFRDPQQSDNYKAEQEAVVYQAGGHSYVRVPSRFASVMNIFSVHNLRMNKGSWPGSRYEEMISTDSRFGVQAHVRPQGADNNNRQNYHEYQNRRVSAHRAGQGGGRGVPRGPSAASRGRNNRMHEGVRELPPYENILVTDMMNRVVAMVFLNNIMQMVMDMVLEIAI